VAAESHRVLSRGQERPELEGRQPSRRSAYDLFGNGKTAIKASASRAVEQDSIRYAIANNPASTLVTSVSRVWNDTNNNFVPDCDLLNPQPNGECLIWQDLGFGSARPTTFYDPRVLNGWGVRPWNWEFSGGVQQEIIPGCRPAWPISGASTATSTCRTTRR
jgi:hypothetical protein